ncbi:MAG: sulfatase-like hydrolase/transferase, partial [Gemmatimonadetes bacterium]|nr:sulfatase-like hydrolase/transferase [Gemmatimonadota bacterium]
MRRSAWKRRSPRRSCPGSRPWVCPSCRGFSRYRRRSRRLRSEPGRPARQGARLTSFYTASPTCTVSRACLLTGRIPQRHGLTKQLPGLKGNYGVGLSQQETLIPQILKTAPTPYATGCFGKWNIGFAKGSRPTERIMASLPEERSMDR